MVKYQYKWITLKRIGSDAEFERQLNIIGEAGGRVVNLRPGPVEKDKKKEWYYRDWNALIEVSINQ